MDNYELFMTAGTVFFVAGTLHVAIGMFFGFRGLLQERKFKKERERSEAEFQERMKQEQAQMEELQKKRDKELKKAMKNDNIKSGKKDKK